MRDLLKQIQLALFPMTWGKAIALTTLAFSIVIGISTVGNLLDPNFDPANDTALYAGDIAVIVVFGTSFIASAILMLRSHSTNSRRKSLLDDLYLGKSVMLNTGSISMVVTEVTPDALICEWHDESRRPVRKVYPRQAVMLSKDHPRHELQEKLASRDLSMKLRALRVNERELAKKEQESSMKTADIKQARTIDLPKGTRR